MIRRGESGWVDVRRVFMVARWWCERVAPQVSTGNRTRATIKALPSPLHLPRPYGKGISPQGCRATVRGYLSLVQKKALGVKLGDLEDA